MWRRTQGYLCWKPHPKINHHTVHSIFDEIVKWLHMTATLGNGIIHWLVARQLRDVKSLFLKIGLKWFLLKTRSFFPSRPQELNGLHRKYKSVLVQLTVLQTLFLFHTHKNQAIKIQVKIQKETFNIFSDFFMYIKQYKINNTQKKLNQHRPGWLIIISPRMVTTSSLNQSRHGEVTAHAQDVPYCHSNCSLRPDLNRFQDVGDKFLETKKKKKRIL